MDGEEIDGAISGDQDPQLAHNETSLEKRTHAQMSAAVKVSDAEDAIDLQYNDQNCQYELNGDTKL